MCDLLTVLVDYDQDEISSMVRLFCCGELKSEDQSNENPPIYREYRGASDVRARIVLDVDRLQQRK